MCVCAYMCVCVCACVYTFTISFSFYLSFSLRPMFLTVSHHCSLPPIRVFDGFYFFECRQMMKTGEHYKHTNIKI